MKVKNGSGPREGSYQLKRKRGTVPLQLSEQTRRFIAAARVGGEKFDLNGARRDHDQYIYRTFGPVQQTG